MSTPTEKKRQVYNRGHVNKTDYYVKAILDRVRDIDKEDFDPSELLDIFDDLQLGLSHRRQKLLEDNPELR